MTVTLAKTAGFCMGVRRAVDMVLDLAHRRQGERLYTYGPLIHNPQMVEILRQRGIVPIRGVGEIPPDGPPPAVILRAHGIPPAEWARLQEKGVRIVDATCPKVGRVQAIIRKHAAEGYAILIAGDRDHPEVEGLLGYAGDRGRVLSRSEDVEALPFLDKVCVVAQTTQSTDQYAELCACVRGRFPGALVFDTICRSTEERQAEVKELARATDAMVIVGGRNSANTRRLAEISRLQGAPTFHIETAGELDCLPLREYDRIGLSAGASTPIWAIDRVADHLTDRQEKRAWHRRLFRLWLFLVRTDVYSALGAGCLALAAILLQGLSASLLSILTASLYVYAMHILNRFIRGKVSPEIGSFREESYRKHERLYVRLALLALALSLAIAFYLGAASFGLLLLLAIAGMLYNARFLPAHWRFHSVGDIPGSKNLSMAAAWGLVTAVLPAMAANGGRFSPALVVAFLFCSAMVFVRSALSDLRDIQGDRFVGKETIPVVIGPGKTRMLLWGVSAATAGLMAVAAAARWIAPGGLIFLGAVFYMWICMHFCGRETRFSGIVLEGLLETGFVIAGAGALVWRLSGLFPAA